MKNPYASSRIQILFSTYHTILRHHFLSSLLEDNQNVWGQHIFSIIKPTSSEIGSNMASSSPRSSWRRTSRVFGHSRELSASFQLWDTCAFNESQSFENNSKNSQSVKQSNKNGRENSTAGPTKSLVSVSGTNKYSRTLNPIYLWPHRQERGIWHLHKYCWKFSQEGKPPLWILGKKVFKRWPFKINKDTYIWCIYKLCSLQYIVKGQIFSTTSSYQYWYSLILLSNCYSAIQGEKHLLASARCDDGINEMFLSLKLTEKYFISVIETWLWYHL